MKIGFKKIAAGTEEALKVVTIYKEIMDGVKDAVAGVCTFAQDMGEEEYETEGVRSSAGTILAIVGEFVISIGEDFADVDKLRVSERSFRLRDTIRRCGGKKVTKGVRPVD